ncbi:hypothetical protein QA633_23065 [Bradyrhizobium barranii]|uniref:hypothetical protein n=1 Tax=Bradyrhizobium barranii TaxID=2992140 RepID=UPI0024AFAAE0|nr:hypothetical protein [Bradyrhizobium barranii]WFT91258.1 hypothetical protein QA633_23065 [Bradyrhizobium barranii]
MRYKAFVVDSSRQVICAATLDCIDEQAARRRAEQMHGEHDVELWEGDRFIAVFRGATSNENRDDRAILNRRPVSRPS